MPRDLPPLDFRLRSLDQFRGFTVLGMFVVNFISGFEHTPHSLHHDYAPFGWHDTVMPQFFLAVGFSLRLAFLRHAARDGLAAARWRVVKRGLGLILLGVVVYQLTGGYQSWQRLTEAWQSSGPGGFLLAAIKRKPFEALTHIGVTTLFVLPVLAASAWIRALYAVLSAAIHIAVSRAGYYEWNLSSPPGVDGGPLGFLTWSIPVIAGTLAHDWVMRAPDRPSGGVRTILALAVTLMLAGYALSCLNRWPGTPPFTPLAEGSPARSLWTMSQRSGSASYQAFGGGFALAVYAVFRLVSDGAAWNSNLLDVFGRNALAGYLVHGFVAEVVKQFTPRDAPALFVWSGFAVYLAIVWVILRYLDKHRLYLRL